MLHRCSAAESRDIAAFVRKCTHGAKVSATWRERCVVPSCPDRLMPVGVNKLYMGVLGLAKKQLVLFLCTSSSSGERWTAILI